MWRVEYKNKVSNQTQQKRVAVITNRRRFYAEKKAAMQQPPQPIVQRQEDLYLQPEQSAESKSPETSGAARRKALQRARAALPVSPRKFLRTVKDLFDKASPRIKRIFREASGNADIGRKVKKYLTLIKNKKSTAAVTAKRIC